MKIETSIVTAALVLAASVATPIFAAEEPYPAADFKPSVIFSDPELIARTSGATGGGSAGSVQAAPTAEFDPKYPAAYFVPSILYPAP